MKRRFLNIALSVAVGLLFLWLAFRNIELAELWGQIKNVSYSWLPFFLFFMTLSHMLRAERWLLLLPEKDQKANRSTLFAGVMLGYVVNNILPRLGEISRPVYVAQKTKASTGNLVGTIVAERLFDIFVLFMMVVFALFVLVNDPAVLQALFGIQQWVFWHYLIIPALFTGLIISVWLFYKIIVQIEKKHSFKNPVISKMISSARSFGEGMVSLKKVKNWPLFLILTTGIWGGYIMMTYLAFYMLDLQQLFDLNLLDGILLTIISSVGVSIPVPGGIGSFHLLMQQGMHLFYEIPLSVALTYATVVHGVTFVFVFVLGAFSLWWDKYYTLAVLKNVND